MVNLLNAISCMTVRLFKSVAVFAYKCVSTAIKMLNVKNKMAELEKRWDIPEEHKQIYSRGLHGKHINGENEKFVAELREILESVNERSYETRLHNLLYFEETAERECLKKQSVDRTKIQRMSRMNIFAVLVPDMERKQRYVRIDDSVVLISLINPTQRLKAKITDINSNHINVSVKSAVNLRINMNEPLKLIFLFSNFQHELMHNAVDDIISSGHKSKVFPEENIKCNAKTPIITWYNIEIARNVEQCAAVEHIVSRTSVPAPFILHGPPGTGKTATIVEAILQVLRKDPSSKIMVCTPSNSAADDVACKLIKYKNYVSGELFVLRKNSSKRDWSTLPSCLKKYSNVHVEICEKLSKEMVEHEKRRIKGTSIVISTISHAGSLTRGVQPYITHLFIDEAAQAIEPLCLVPITKLLVPDGLLVLSGDPLQLGPIIISQYAKEFGLGVSLMERLMNDDLYKSNDPNYTVMLKKNFRSHGDILKIPNIQFYGGELEACAKEDAISRKDILNEGGSSRAIVFYAIFGQEAQENNSSSYFNEDELLMLQYCLKKLITGASKEKPEDIGIITPYTAQVDKIKKWLKSKGLVEVEVGSVESYQGREKKIILMSTVRGQGTDTTKKVKLGFLADSKRFNVALTRAKSKLIVIGNPYCLQKDKMWRIYIDVCKGLNSYENGGQYLKNEKLINLTAGFGTMRINRRC